MAVEKVKVGNYRQNVDMTNMEPEMVPTLQPKKKEYGPDFGGIASSVARGIMNITGSRRSPSTTRDVGHATSTPVRSDAEVEAAYQKELASRKKP